MNREALQAAPKKQLKPKPPASRPPPQLGQQHVESTCVRLAEEEDMAAASDYYNDAEEADMALELGVVEDVDDQSWGEWEARAGVHGVEGHGSICRG